MPDSQFTGPIDHLKEELSQIRTGRANPSFIEDLIVEVYETKTPLKELASISVPEPQSLVVQPWDTSILKNIEKAVQNSSLGLQPINDGQVIRLVFPPLTEERRTQFIKLVNEKTEESRVALRSLREKEMKKIKQEEQLHTISEDDSKKLQKDLQKLVDEATKEVSEISQAKEKDIATI